MKFKIGDLVQYRQPTEITGGYGMPPRAKENPAPHGWSSWKTGIVLEHCEVKDLVGWIPSKVEDIDGAKTLDGKWQKRKTVKLYSFSSKERVDIGRFWDVEIIK